MRSERWSGPAGGAAPTTAPPPAAKAAAPTTAPAAAAAGGAATPTPAAASIAGPTPTPYPVANYGSNSAKVSIRYWTILGSVDGIVMNDLVRKFAEANPDIRVESLQGVTDFITKMEAAAISNTAPDVAIVRHTYVGPFAIKNVLSPLTQAELTRSASRPRISNRRSGSSRSIRAPSTPCRWISTAHAMVYNKAIIAAAGMKPPTTLEEWQAVNDKITKDDVLGYNTFAIGAGAQEFMTWYWYGIVRQFGVDMLNCGCHQGRVQYTRRCRGRQLDAGHAAEGQPEDGARRRSAAHR